MKNSKDFKAQKRIIASILALGMIVSSSAVTLNLSAEAPTDYDGIYSYDDNRIEVEKDAVLSLYDVDATNKTVTSKSGEKLSFDKMSVSNLSFKKNAYLAFGVYADEDSEYELNIGCLPMSDSYTENNQKDNDDFIDDKFSQATASSKYYIPIIANETAYKGIVYDNTRIDSMIEASVKVTLKKGENIIYLLDSTTDMPDVKHIKYDYVKLDENVYPMNVDSIVMSGDANMDREVNIKDLINMKKSLADTSLKNVPYAVDFDNDKTITSDEMVTLKKMLMNSENAKDSLKAVESEAKIGNMVYNSFMDAIDDAGVKSLDGTPCKIEITAPEKLVINKTVTLPKSSNIIISDDGKIRTIKRGEGFIYNVRGVMFDVKENVTLSFESTSNSDDHTKLTLDGDNGLEPWFTAIYKDGKITGYTGTNWAFMNVFSNGTVNISSGVKFMNNKSSGAGAVIRCERNSKAKVNINGGIFSSNEAIANCASLLYVTAGTKAVVKNATVENSGCRVGAMVSGVIYSEGNCVTIDNCLFKNNFNLNGTAAVLAVVNDGYSTIKENGVASISNSKFIGNTAYTGGICSVVTGGTLNVDNVEFKNNNSIEGNGIRTGGVTSVVNISGKSIIPIYNCSQATIHIKGQLSDGSAIESDWRNPDLLVKEQSGVAFDFDDNMAESNMKYLSVGATVTNAEYSLSLADNKAYIAKG